MPATPRWDLAAAESATSSLDLSLEIGAGLERGVGERLLMDRGGGVGGEGAQVQGEGRGRLGSGVHGGDEIVGRAGDVGDT